MFSGVFGFFSELVEKRYVIGQLVRRDLKERYIGSFFGFVWPFLQQLLLVLIMGFVLQMGLRVQPVLNIPFIAWLVPAFSMWAFFSEAVNTSVNVFVQYSYLVKKINFRISILPLVKVLAAVVNHLLFWVVLVVILLFNGIYPSIYWIQFLYYAFACACLCLGLGWLLSSFAVFVKDVGQLITIGLNFFMWMTPLFWDINNLSNDFQTLTKFNPVSYLTEGYRNTFLYRKWFWEVDPLWTLYFWSVTVIFLVGGVVVFKKLKPHFADVL